jgi:hypothetical protein
MCFYFAVQIMMVRQVYGRLKSMTSHVSERDKEQVVIDLGNLKTISMLRHKNMGMLPPELNALFVSASHFVCRLLVACTSYARAPSPNFMRAGHACVVVLNNIAARTAGTQMNSEAVRKNLEDAGSMLITSLCAVPIFVCIFLPSSLLQDERAHVDEFFVSGLNSYHIHSSLRFLCPLVIHD